MTPCKKGPAALGVPALDLDHMQMETLLDLLREALPLLPSPVADMVLNRLMREAENHFRREESILRRSRADGWEDHIQGHDQFRHVLAKLQQAIEAEEQAKARALIAEAKTLYLRVLHPADMAFAHLFGMAEKQSD